MAGTVVAYQFIDPILHFLIRPVGRLNFFAPTEAFFLRLKIAVVAGLFLALPFVIYQIWKFISLGLEPDEKKYFWWVLPASFTLFIAGAFFGIFVLLPAGIKFLLSYASADLAPMISAASYFDFVSAFALSLGALFQMPLVTFFLGRFGILESRWLSSKRGIAVIVIYIACAVITPGPDPVTAMLLAVPTYFLFELSIITARIAAQAPSR